MVVFIVYTRNGRDKRFESAGASVFERVRKLITKLAFVMVSLPK